VVFRSASCILLSITSTLEMWWCVLVNDIALSLWQSILRPPCLPPWFTLLVPEHDEEWQHCDNQNILASLLANVHRFGGNRVGRIRTSDGSTAAGREFFHSRVRREVSKSWGLPFSTGVPSLRMTIHWSANSDASSGFCIEILPREKNFIKRDGKWVEFRGSFWESHGILFGTSGCTIGRL